MATTTTTAHNQYTTLDFPPTRMTGRCGHCRGLTQPAYDEVGAYAGSACVTCGRIAYPATYSDWEAA